MTRAAVLLAMVPLAACVTVPWTSSCSIKYTNLVDGNKASDVVGVEPDATVMTDAFNHDAMSTQLGSDNVQGGVVDSHYINTPDSLTNFTLVTFTGWKSWPGQHKVDTSKPWTIDIQVSNTGQDIYFFHQKKQTDNGKLDANFPTLQTENPGWTLVPETKTVLSEKFLRINKANSGCTGPPWATTECITGEMILYKKTLTETLTKISLTGELKGGLAYQSWEEFCHNRTSTTTITTTTGTMTTTATNTTTSTTMLTEISSAGGRGTINGFRGLLAVAVAVALSACGLSVK